MGARAPWVLIGAAVGLSILGGLSACAVFYRPGGTGQDGRAASPTRGFSDAHLARYASDMDGAMLSLARRHDPRPHTDYWGRVRGWERLDLANIPHFSAAVPDFDSARLINALRGSAPLPVDPAPPFVLKASAADRTKALRCLTEAVYYEAGFEPLAGQEAVAQTILNRLRHAGYPKSICGVVYEGAARSTGCQFSFTCDGSLAREPNPSLWTRAESVARRALNGFVMKDVGVATHYHANYVAPYWAPTLVKLTQIGQHIFYRWTGPSGTLAAFRGRYRGGEDVTPDILLAADARILGGAPPSENQAVSLPLRPALDSAALARAEAAGVGSPALAPQARLVMVPDASAPGGERLRFQGVVAGRRIPTPDEVDRINQSLEGLARELADPPAAGPARPRS
ncbi:MULTISPECIES: cell wall hydrolase [unclassified Caulobacter]|uniref:cell wall hydrolase n=1 Tax=unclassified Caulobacter TaxID=2648921 RepID=UPI001E4E9E3C|nr:MULTISPECIES: cell wall hydrolase [unclassified Caulobacter]